MATTTTSKNSTTQEVAWLTGAAKDEILLGAGAGSAMLDVLGNDPGSAVLHGVYTTVNVYQNASTSTALAASLTAATTLGGTVRIVNGKVEYTPPSSGPGAAALGALHAGETLNDSFNYVIWMGQKGAYSLATTTVILVGVDDPAVIGGDTAGSVQEDLTPQATGTLTVVDPDAGESGFQGVTENGAHGVFTLLANGAWTYDLDNASVNSLGEGAQVVENFTVASIDGTQQDIAVTILGTNDAAVIGGDSTGVVKEDLTLQASGTLTEDDPDEGQSGFQDAILNGAHGVLTLLENGDWTYDLDNASVNSLAEGAQVVDSFTVASIDGTQQVIDVTVTGTNDAPTAGSDAAATSEATPILIDVLANDTDPDSTALVVASVGTAVPGGSASLGDDGRVRFDPGSAFEHLAAGAQATVTIGYVMQDDHGAQVDGTVTVTVQGMNDPAAFEGGTTGQVTEDAVLETGGVLVVRDVDDGQARLTTHSGLEGAHGDFAIDLDTGVWSYTLRNDAAHVQQLGTGTTASDFLYVVSADGSIATVSVDIVGADEPDRPPMIWGDLVGTVKDNVTTHAEGKLSVDDPDANESGMQAGTLVGAFGVLTMEDNGEWTYDLDNAKADPLSEGMMQHDFFTVHSIDGTPQDIGIMVFGSNDPAVFQGATTGAVVEDSAQQVVNGQLLALDPDHGQFGLQAATVAGEFGNLEITSAGGWKYTLDAVKANSIGGGSQKVDTLTVRSFDGTPQEIAITVKGADDSPVANPDFASTQENQPVLIDVLANDTDPDSALPEYFDVFGAPAGAAASATANGIYFNPQSAFDDLPQGVQTTVTFEYLLAGPITATSHNTVTLTITGVNDPASITTANSLYTVTEDGNLYANGKFLVSDVDGGEARLSSAYLGTTGYGNFSLDPLTGEWSYRLDNDSPAVQALAANQEVYDTLSVHSFDMSTGAVVTVHIVGANEPSPGGGPSGHSSQGMV